MQRLVETRSELQSVITLQVEVCAPQNSVVLSNSQLESSDTKSWRGRGHIPAHASPDHARLYCRIDGCGLRWRLFDSPPAHGPPIPGFAGVARQGDHNFRQEVKIFWRSTSSEELPGS